MTKDAKNRFLSKLEQMAEELYRRGVANGVNGMGLCGVFSWF